VARIEPDLAKPPVVAPRLPVAGEVEKYRASMPDREKYVQ
jgi:hypothetical protein